MYCQTSIASSIIGVLQPDEGRPTGTAEQSESLTRTRTGPGVARLSGVDSDLPSDHPEPPGSFWTSTAVDLPVMTAAAAGRRNPPGRQTMTVTAALTSKPESPAMISE